jgi:hypothetical protein
MDWSAIVGNVASGGLLGLVGSIASTGIAIWQTREQRKAKREEAELEMKRMELAGRIDLEKATASLRETETRAMSSNFDASQAADANAHGASDFVADFKAMTRHVVVYLLIVLTGIIYFVKASPELQATICGVIVQLATMAVSWLYGQRATLQAIHYINAK